MRACVHACVRACVRLCVRACVCVCVCVRVLLSSLEYIRPSVIQNGVIENYKFDLFASKVFSNQDTKLNQTIH